MNGEVDGWMFAVDSRFIHPGEVGVDHPHSRGLYSPIFKGAGGLLHPRPGACDIVLASQCETHETHR